MRSLLPRLLLFPAALLLCALVVRLTGNDPVLASKALLHGAMGSPRNLTDTAAKTIPLAMTGLGVVLAFRAGFFNIGAEGQFLVGALAATALGVKTSCSWPVLVLAGATAGGAWAALAAWMKLRRGAPEIITTIMLNYVAVQLVALTLQIPDNPKAPRGWLLESDGQQAQSDVLPAAAQIPPLVADTNLHCGVFIALLCVAACWRLLFKSERGFLMRAAGANPLAARAAGINANNQAQWAVSLSGALCGLGGAMEIAGNTHQLNTTPPGYGYTAIAVALLGGLNPLGVLPSAALFAVLATGGGAMERNAGVPAVTVSIITGVLVCCAALLPKIKND